MTAHCNASFQGMTLCRAVNTVPERPAHCKQLTSFEQYVVQFMEQASWLVATFRSRDDSPRSSTASGFSAAVVRFPG